MAKAKGDLFDNQKVRDREIAENAGVLGVLGDTSELSGVFGSSALNSSLTGAIGGLYGAVGTQMGTGGLGNRGNQLGGGGEIDGGIGLGTRGRSRGDGTYGQNGGNMGPRTSGALPMSNEVITLGALDKGLIDQVIKQNMNQIRYCYQRELTKSPDLGGKIVVKFVIAKDGSVSKATTKKSTMGSAAVEGCINSRFMRFKFPEPKGGGIVIVSYPFMFSAGS